jgi:hypothetical protein
MTDKAATPPASKPITVIKMTRGDIRQPFVDL